MGDTEESGGTEKRRVWPRRFTWVEAVVIAGVWIVFAAVILFPLTIRDYPYAWMTQCANNQRQISFAIMTWTQENTDTLPPMETMWTDTRVMLVSKSLNYATPATVDKIMVCPAASKLANGYVYNSRIAGMSIGDPTINPVKDFLIADGQHKAMDGKPANVAFKMADLDLSRHPWGEPRFVAAFLDGHSDVLKPEEAKGWLPE